MTGRLLATELAMESASALKAEPLLIPTDWDACARSSRKERAAASRATARARTMARKARSGWLTEPPLPRPTALPLEDRESPLQILAVAFKIFSAHEQDAPIASQLPGGVRGQVAVPSSRREAAEEVLHVRRRPAQPEEGDAATLLCNCVRRQRDAARRPHQPLGPAGFRHPAGQDGGRAVEISRHSGEVVVETAARVAGHLCLVVHVREYALDAGAQIERAAVRRDDRAAAARVVNRVVGAGARTALVDGARVLILAAGGRLEGGGVADAAARIGAGARQALGLHALVRGGAAVVDRLVDAGAVVAEVVRAGGAVVAVERDPGARPGG